MKLNERQKMCTTCDGRIPLDANLCPYCAAEQGAGQVYLQHKSIQESLTSLYPPPYGAKNPNFVKEQPAVKRSSHSQESMFDKKFQQTSPTASSPMPFDHAEEQHPVEEKMHFWPLFLLSIGTNLLVVGLLQFFFSENGFLTLQWNSRYWFVYCLAAIFPLYIGFKKVNSISKIA